MVFRAMKLQVIWITAAALLAGAPAGAAEDKLGFETTALPVFRAKCIKCHSGSAPQASLDLQTAQSALKGGKSGPAIQPGAPARSLLFERVVSKSMPPGPEKLTEPEIAAIRGWTRRPVP
jgi:mono/diheme cytochrome c family protein